MLRSRGDGERAPAVVCVDDRGILRIVIQPGARLDEASTRDVMTRTLELAEGRKLPTLVDARGVRAMSMRAVRKCMGGE